MSAEESQDQIETLGVIAGGGVLPERLLHACDKRGIVPFVIGFEGQTDPLICKGRNHLWTRIGAAGQIINTLKSHGIRDLVLIGSMRRPSIHELKPDIRTARFFARLGVRALGDDNLLRAIRSELEAEGFVIHGVQDFAHDLLVGEGPIGRVRPRKIDWIDIDRGIEISRMMGALDVGQATVIQEGIVLGVEAIEGTDELIRRCAKYKRAGRGGVLVKTCKPRQDEDLDLPTVGPNTVRLCAEAGLSGVVIQAHRSLLIDPQEVADIANRHNIFVIGLDILKVAHKV
ncbi:MAG: LpxI family protein [Alphaproteobacteria bacterium]|nr:LpxI family protein [Alphaproteobacteria bacterium]